MRSFYFKSSKLCKRSRQNPQIELTLKYVARAGPRNMKKKYQTFVKASITELIFIRNTCLTLFNKCIMTTNVKVSVLQ